MASQCYQVLVLFLVLVGSATLGTSEADTTYPFPPPPAGPEPFPISNYDNGEVQFIGKFAVDQYNKRSGGAHLYFLQVVGGTVYETPRAQFRLWDLDIRAINCTHSGTPDLYEARVFGPGLAFDDLRKKMN